MKENEKAELLKVLQFYLFERFARPDSSFLAKKTAQVLALMACCDGLHLCASLLEEVKSYLLSCLQNRDFVKITTGLYSLRVIIEQMLSPCEAIGSIKTNEIQRWFITESVTVYNLLSRVMLFLLDAEVMNRTQTLLRGSPSAGNRSSLSEAGYPAFQLTQALINDVSEQSVNKYNALLAWLECLMESFKRLPPDCNFLDGFCNALFLLSLIGSPTFISACSTGSNLSVNNYSSNSLLSSVCLTSLACIQEMVDRKDLTTEVMQRNLWNLFPILQYHLSLSTGETAMPWSVTNGGQHQVRSYNKNLAETVAADTESQVNTTEYQLKLLDILKSVMTNFFHQLFSSTPLATTVGVDPFRFLGLLHDFTFATLDLDTYVSSLSVWNAFLEFLNVQYCSSSDKLGSSCMDSLPSNLHESLFTLGKALFSRLLHSESANFLETLDQDVSEDGSEYTTYYSSDTPENHDVMVLFRHDNSLNKVTSEPSEYRMFLRETLTTLAAVLGFVPGPLINVILGRYYAAWNDYVNFIQSSDVLSSGGVVFQLRSQPLHRVHWSLRDFATITQTVGFVMDSISTSVSSSIHDILQSLLYCLILNNQVVTHLNSLKQPLIRSDIITVIVENLMTLQSIILGNYLLLTSDQSAMIPGKIPLSAEQKDLLMTQIMQALAAFCLPVNSLPSTVPPPIQVCSARLFNAICTSTLFNESSINPSPKTNSSTIRDIFFQFMEILCDEKQRALLPFNVLRILLRSCVQFLAPLPLEEATVTGDLLERLVLRCYSPYLKQNVLHEDPVVHMLSLGLLNDAVDGMDSLSSYARRHMQTILAGLGLLEELVLCATRILSTDVHASINVIRACTAYLTFFTTYIRVLSQTGAIGSTIPELLGRIIRALYSNSTGSQCDSFIPACLIDRLLNMFLLIAKNRRLFVSLLGDILNLCLYRLLPGLGFRRDMDAVPTDEILPELVFSAGMHNPGSLQLLCELLFAALSEGFAFFFETKPRANTFGNVNNAAMQNSNWFANASQRYVLIKADEFNRIMLVLTSVFHERQVSSSLISFTLDGLCALHRLRKLFDLQPFNSYWLPELMHKLLSLLINKQHDSSKDAILSGLHSLTVSGMTQYEVADWNKSSTFPKCSAFFVQYFLPAFFNTLPYFDGTQQSIVLAHFYRSSQTVSPNAPNPVELIDLSNLDTFGQLITQLVIDLRAFRANSATKTSLPSPSDPEKTT
ncbi:unnamed protein product [Echinostoma caproni]|uniref:Protein dopey-1 n=1 Tax=Echinostoma caproni TaxID=27848 RepID=A0A183AEF9_9TREM|nr:unnamed protein product [Echinostoma caproni]